MVVYSITNIITGRVYIGSTKQYSIRKIQHLDSLRNKTHHNRRLQKDFIKYGECSFVFDIVESGFKTYQLMVYREYEIINKTENRYNVLTFDYNPHKPLSGGKNAEYHVRKTGGIIIKLKKKKAKKRKNNHPKPLPVIKNTDPVYRRKTKDGDIILVQSSESKI